MSPTKNTASQHIQIMTNISQLYCLVSGSHQCNLLTNVNTQKKHLDKYSEHKCSQNNNLIYKKCKLKHPWAEQLVLRLNGDVSNTAHLHKQHNTIVTIVAVRVKLQANKVVFNSKLLISIITPLLTNISVTSIPIIFKTKFIAKV